MRDGKKGLGQGGSTVEIMKAILTVKEKTYLTPHYIRVILEGDDIHKFANANIGDNNKIFIPKNGMVQLPDDGQPNGERPLMRTYTLRTLDLAKKEMGIDFVAHGDNGPASRWAIHAEVGEQLGVAMKVKSRPLFQSADWYLLAGDHTALPVISVILEKLPSDAKGKVFLEVYSSEDVLELTKPKGVELQWIFNAQSGKVPTLPKAIQNTLLPDGSKFIYVAAEYTSVIEIQQYLRSYNGLDRSEWQTYSYWKYGQSEDSSTEGRKGSINRG
ncbi:siderophore-interacting protein [Elizabethkingia anophelis]|nr:siderophore-interacting protein [Elizabethkingia anophelis]MCT4062924.1 siderophore-interacting protein [Elizabethkingia anophelis]MCT4109215.1 siderophore-interacting protein [Elizabethkingia anophelis]